VTARRLRSMGLARLVDVRTAESAALAEAVGSHAEWLIRLSRGIDDRGVEPDRPRKSAGTERTFAADRLDLAGIRTDVAEMAGKVPRGSRARACSPARSR